MFPDLKNLSTSVLKCNCGPQENTIKSLRDILQKFFISKKKHVCKWFFDCMPKMWSYIHSCSGKVPDYVSGTSSLMDRSLQQLNKCYQNILLHHMKFPESDTVNITETVEFWIENSSTCAQRGSKLPGINTAIDYSVQCSLKHDSSTEG
eukprot:UN28185